MESFWYPDLSLAGIVTPVGAIAGLKQNSGASNWPEPLHSSIGHP